VKYGIRKHIEVASCSGCAMHCCAFAVGASCTSKTHSIEGCAACLNYTQLSPLVRKFANAIRNNLARENPSFHPKDTAGPLYEIETMLSIVGPIGKILQAYHKHVARAVWQAHQINRVVDQLDVGTVVLVIDHKMKIKPINFKENSAEWYGQKGVSLLGAYARWRETSEGPVLSHYFDSVLIGRKQNALQVQVVLENLVAEVKQLVSLLKSIVLVSDNGAAFSNYSNFQFVWSRNLVGWKTDVVITRWMFFEAQCGKTALDTHFSFVSKSLQTFAKKERAVKTATDVFEGLISDGGITNVYVSYRR
jgi:hypothetical protein